MKTKIVLLGGVLEPPESDLQPEANVCETIRQVGASAVSGTGLTGKLKFGKV